MSDSVTHLIEKDAIRDLLSQYCFAVDSRRYGDMAALFAADGRWQTAFGEAAGRAAIEALMRRLMPPFGTGPRALHATTNVVITLAGERAHVTSNWLVVRNGPDGPSCDGGGLYLDEVVKEDGRWRFLSRRIDRFIHRETDGPPP